MRRDRVGVGYPAVTSSAPLAAPPRFAGELVRRRGRNSDPVVAGLATLFRSWEKTAAVTR